MCARVRVHTAGSYQCHTSSVPLVQGQSAHTGTVNVQRLWSPVLTPKGEDKQPNPTKPLKLSCHCNILTILLGKKVLGTE